MTSLGPHAQLVALAHATADPAARAEIMDALRDIAPYAGGDNAVADQFAAHVLARLGPQTSAPSNRQPSAPESVAPSG